MTRKLTTSRKRNLVSYSITKWYDIEMYILPAEESQPIVRHTTPSLHLVPPDPDCMSLEEECQVTTFLVDGCRCKLAGGLSCSGQFSEDYLLTTRGQCCELSHTELDMALMGQFHAVLNNSGDILNMSR